MTATTLNSENVFLVIWHPEHDGPRSSMVEAENEDQAWEAVCANYYDATGIEDEELYLDHVKTLRELSTCSGITLTASK